METVINRSKPIKPTRTRNRTAGEGSISQRASDNLFIAQLTLGYDDNGKQIRKSVSAKTRKECAEKLKALINDRDKGELIKSSKITVKDWLLDWLNNYKKLTIKQTTYDSYIININNHLIPQIGKTELQKLTTEQIQKMINDMVDKKLTKTIRYSAYILSSSLKQARKLKMIVSNPCDNIVLPKSTSKPIRILTIEELKHFKETIKDHYLYPAFLIQMTTGIRKGEVLSIGWDDVNLDEGYISIRKNLVKTSKGVILDTPKTKNSIRDVPIIAEVVLLLMNLKNNKTGGLVFTTSSGKYIHPRNYQRSFDMLLKKAGLIKPEMPKPRIHDLRHTFATMLIENGLDIKSVSSILGHSNCTFTANVYVHTNIKKSFVINKIRSVFG